MVATAGVQDGERWQLAPSLVALVDECDRLHPSRSIASDGSIGDPAHRDRTSDHNPDSSGDVLAVDITDDKMHGCDADLLAQHLVANRDPRIKYVIWNRTIVKSYGTQAWVPQPYTGSNAHDKHTHISIRDTPAAKADTSPWWPTAAPLPSEEDDMPKATYIREKSSGQVFLAGLTTPPRKVTLFADAEYHAAREGLTILNPPADAAQDVRDANGTIRKVMVVNDGDLFGI